MKSGKQRRAELKTKRKQREAKQRSLAAGPQATPRPLGTAPVNEALLASYKSYGAPDYAMRGYYQDLPFRCLGCGKEEIWTASQQKWWYEVAKGFVYATAVRCRLCRRKKRQQSEESRRVHLEGLERKARRNRQGSK